MTNGGCGGGTGAPIWDSGGKPMAGGPGAVGWIMIGPRSGEERGDLDPDLDLSIGWVYGTVGI